ncbi:helix-turn-helix domain-containing protein [Natrialba swarupiae]|uniref:Uncharacterized protein n=1 Tax=Natrialba swarupiae TaxID=2448032 RepID=A0A5D5APN9_9EURY|nr:helix-turn-helix transcriptional regulator [Natrialba swarupiae]MCW8173685.1 hypothetical protein [Natrialba swarupiae]MCW8173782.1 hypothetical protein [Natrialba swarupiae]TYT61712.1 hypothetical protein FYC77_11765 [Natrialba swarupiae]
MAGERTSNQNRLVEDPNVVRETVPKDYYETVLHHGQLYPNLDTLVDKDFVEKRQANIAQPSGHLSERSSGLEEVVPTNGCSVV